MFYVNPESKANGRHLERIASVKQLKQDGHAKSDFRLFTLPPALTPFAQDLADMAPHRWAWFHSVGWGLAREMHPFASL